ncbi:MAG: protein kinase [Myxococcota bacterium]|nr:protein kinase [Myxococcota bacterium]
MSGRHSGQIVDGRYKVLRLLGEGGMGSVYLGQHLIIGKRVAIKFLSIDRADDTDMIERFYREARAAAEIGHRNIVDVFDVGVLENSEFYLIMEYLEGESLASLLHRVGTIDLNTACGIFEQILLGLSAAHEKGIIHRDLKPENIFIVSHKYDEPTIKLIDFGISRFVRETKQPRLTRTGFTLGTPAYMSPEHVRSAKHIDHRSDLFSAGVVFYEMLSGVLPFEGDDYYELISNILTNAPTPLSEICEELPTDLSTLISRVISKDPASRPQSAAALLGHITSLTKAKDRRDGLKHLAARILCNDDAGDASVDLTNHLEHKSPAIIQRGNTTYLSTPNEWSEAPAPEQWSSKKFSILAAIGICLTVVGIGAFYLGLSYGKQAEQPASNNALGETALPEEIPQPETNLVWLRCVAGTKWNGTACKGKRLEMTHIEAQAFCPATYRLPTRSEFIELLGQCEDAVKEGQIGRCKRCRESTVCSSMFGNDKGWYWSATFNKPDRAWFISFSDGYVSNYNVANKTNVRCVRTAM